MTVMKEEVLAYLAEHPMPRHPRLLRALARDALVFAYHRGEIAKLRTRFQRGVYALLLPFRASEYFALILYRLRVVLLRAHIPLLPGILNWTSALGWRIRIDNHVILDEGIYIAHGEMFLGGLTYIGKSCFLGPFISIGPVEGDLRGPVLEEGVFVGTGARILGPLTIGYGARIGANAVVLSDVPAWATAVGVPARIIPRGRTETADDSAQASSNNSEDSACAPS
jgi:serine O-acetyltransferase